MEDTLLKVAQERFGLDYLFPYQRLVITNILAAAEDRGQDRSEYGRQIVILPTGAGKSLCFQLPAAALPGTTLVVYPLLSLMNDQARRMSEGGFSVVQLKGGQEKDERQRALDLVSSGTVDFVITNPETLQSERIRRTLRTAGIVHAVIDEAHCISEWGDSFRPLYLTLGDALEELAVPIVTAFTATAGDHVLQRIREVLFKGAGAREIRGNPDRENISYSVVPCLSRVHALRAMFGPCGQKPARAPAAPAAPAAPPPPAALPAPTPDGDTLPVWHRDDPIPLPAIVFCATRADTRLYAAHLERVLGPGRAFYYHAGLDRERKKTVEEEFFHARDAVLCSTCAYGMGVDKPDIRAVIHTFLPESVEAFLQESGRAGRDREPALSVVLVDPGEEKRYRQGMDTAANGQAGVTTVQCMVFGRECRRAVLLRAMGTDPDACAGCDRCETPAGGHTGGQTGGQIDESARRGARESAIKCAPALFPRESPTARFIHDRIAHAPRRYTATEWVRLFRGRASWQDWCRLIPWRRDFGCFAHWSTEELEAALEQLIALEVLRKRRDGRLVAGPSIERPQIEGVSSNHAGLLKK